MADTSGNYAHHLLWSASTTFQNVGRTFNIFCFSIYVHVANAVLPLFFDLFFYIVLFSSKLTEYINKLTKTHPNTSLHHFLALNDAKVTKIVPKKGQGPPK